jgi:hypothetical protein
MKKPFPASTFIISFANTVVIAGAIVASPAAIAQTSGEPCSSGYVTGVGGSIQSVREYMALPDRDKYRYINDNPIQCKTSDDGRASGCTGITTLSNEKVSVYDDSDSTTTAVTARVELDRETYAVIIAVPKTDLRCKE